MADDQEVRQFKLGLKDAADRLGADLALLTKAVAMRALQGVVLGTRVDTGRARGNWQVTEGAPAEGWDEELKDKDGGATISRGAARVEEATGVKIIWLHNGVPYVGILEEWDKMVEGNLEALATWLQSQGWE